MEGSELESSGNTQENTSFANAFHRWSSSNTDDKQGQELNAGDGAQDDAPPHPPEGVDEVSQMETSEPIPLTEQPSDLREDMDPEKPLLAAETMLLPPSGPVPLPMRPPLRRDGSAPHAPPPAQQPPPVPMMPPAQEGGENPPGSLSLMQLKKLVADLPKFEPAPYDFTYADASSFTEEVEEWFTYEEETRLRLATCATSFEFQWSSLSDLPWHQAEEEEREKFVKQQLDALREGPSKVNAALGSLCYVALGCWKTTAASAMTAKDEGNEPQQAVWIRRNYQLLDSIGAYPDILAILQALCYDTTGATPPPDSSSSYQHAVSSDAPLNQHRLWSAMTMIYLALESFRIAEPDGGDEYRKEGTISAIAPPLLLFLVEIVATLRWDDSSKLPQAKLLMITWKAALVSFGGLTQLERIKSHFQEDVQELKHGQPLITASPLDYHLFRQEISSKYPAYTPPPVLFPLEPENNSMLPPIKASSAIHSARGPSGPTTVNGSGPSIMHQPVHIATPAPSPPPSPGGPGGKGVKKQNYQTNQLFPFLYPPLGSDSNDLGGRGSTELQDALVGRKWEGSDVPTSILEAAELFAKRMKAPRPMRQLWEERVDFMKRERGWTEETASETREKNPHLAFDPSSEKELDPMSRSRLETVEDFYHKSLPHLQSFVIVALKIILTNVTSLITQNSMHEMNSLSNGFQFQDPPESAHPDGPLRSGYVPSNEELDLFRSQEVSCKAVSGIFILLLKWFKLSHVLKFEYMAQLLLDSNYIPLILKLLQSQELERAVTFKCDLPEMNFFVWCTKDASTSPTNPTFADKPEDNDDEDDAIPPPISRRRTDTAQAPPAPTSGEPSPQSNRRISEQPPEVDELGYPTTEIPQDPITDFSWRNFFTNINYLRIMQKLCKNKAHRNLMLVQYKSSQYLRKALKVPQPELRLYTLKLFKNQVPYCGRKWRQSNMRVITAVYLHCRPELRDDWLAGSDVDAEVEESLPLEQALRALTHFYNLKRYPKMMGVERGVLVDEELDFFAKELTRMAMDEDVQFGEEAEWEGGGVDGW